MNSSQQSHTPATPPGAQAFSDGLAHSSIDEDVALGCECADPALHIERWRHEAPQPARDFY